MVVYSHSEKRAYRPADNGAFVGCEVYAWRGGFWWIAVDRIRGWFKNDSRTITPNNKEYTLSVVGCEVVYQRHFVLLVD